MTRAHYFTKWPILILVIFTVKKMPLTYTDFKLIQ